MEVVRSTPPQAFFAIWPGYLTLRIDGAGINARDSNLEGLLLENDWRGSRLGRYFLWWKNVGIDRLGGMR
ncbi:MAG: hypothetical protein C4530_11590 [Desulfobacteraceae bacterium]|nr:MAG: hypothetical protein C4530_11590 [Desulfobacteraceae bacterium]